MTKVKFAGSCGLLVVMLGFGVAAWGQAEVTASQAMEISVFGAGTGTFTGLEKSRNLGITAGADLTFRPLFGIRPAFEIRGTYPIDKGQVIGEKSGLLGLRLMKSYGRFNPYIDGLYGRGELTYVGGFIVGTFRYDRTTTNVFAGGGGVDYRISDHFDLKADVQAERWSTPVTSSGKIYSTPISLGVVYHIDFNRPGHHAKLPKSRPEVTGPIGPPPAAAPDGGVTAAPETTPVPPPPPATDLTAAPATTTPPSQTTGTSNPPPNF